MLKGASGDVTLDVVRGGENHSVQLHKPTGESRLGVKLGESLARFARKPGSPAVMVSEIAQNGLVRA